MKNTIISLLICSSAFSVDAQTQGAISFQETRKLQINIQGDMPPPPDLPTENKNYTVLYFTQDASLYQNDPTKTSDAAQINEEDNNGERVMIHLDAPDNKVYCDLVNKKMTKQTDFMQRKFLIETEISMNGWKLTGKQKTILNYSCMEAVKQDSLQKTVVYFTSSIPVSSGPMDFVGLPGMVLEVNINDGQTIITATSISADVNKDNLKKPDDGKKVTEAEFDKIVDEKMKEMGIDRNGGPNVIIKIEED